MRTFGALFVAFGLACGAVAACVNPGSHGSLQQQAPGGKVESAGGGTGAHCVLRSPPRRLQLTPASKGATCLSPQDTEALQRYLAELSNWSDEAWRRCGTAGGRQ